jgi:hypothetical protein
MPNTIKIFFLALFLSGKLFAQSDPQYKIPTNELKDVSDLVMKGELTWIVSYEEKKKMPVGFETVPLLDTNYYYTRFSEKGIDVLIKAEPFYPMLHKLEYLPNSKNQVLKKIDGRPFWGTHGMMPERKVLDVIVTLRGKIIRIPQTATDGIYNPNFGCFGLFCSSAIYYTKDQKRIYIAMQNSDGAGYYQVVWVFEDGKYVGRIIELGP